MSDLGRRVWKRSRYPITLGEGEDAEQFFLRAMTFDEIEQADAVPDGERMFFILGCALVNADGSAEVHRNGETSAEFAAKAKGYLRDIPSDTLIDLAEKAKTLRRTPNVQAVLKNFATTQS